MSITTITKLLVEAGEACERLHDELVRNVPSRRVECDEAWAFCYAKRRQASEVVGDPEYAGDLWTWAAIDSDTKLVLTWLVSTIRARSRAVRFMSDLESRLAGRVQLTTDGHIPYTDAIDGAFGSEVDYAQQVKVYGDGSNAIGVNRAVITGAPRPGAHQHVLHREAQPDD